MGLDYIKHKEWLHTQKGRASTLLNAYNNKDRKLGRGIGNLTSDWIVENIFPKPCVHCGKTDWRKIGCNRLDNSKPHTTDNVEPCCKECNDKLHKEEISKEVYQYTIDGELVNVWSSTKECGRNGYCQSGVANCAIGKQKIHKGYKWSYIPL